MTFSTRNLRTGQAGSAHNSAKAHAVAVHGEETTHRLVLEAGRVAATTGQTWLRVFRELVANEPLAPR